MTLDSDELLAEQIAYYRARAPEYDRWWEADVFAWEPDTDFDVVFFSVAGFAER